ncbi:hypothetical protein BC834DRAFT_926482 [Gloeopeniophorella convolvens]|nr:hypothetical protein BC834DRAFT_926482 [Gloeopeniophorella convolvens]
MARFEDLPIELLPAIIVNFLRPSHLALLCLVNRAFYAFAVHPLYDRIFIYSWHTSAKRRVTDLFRTLAENPHLASLVHRLEVRDFPKAHGSVQSYEQLRDWCTRGLENAVHLRSCTWTRDGSLTSDILRSLSKCPELTEIAINGGHTGHYGPRDLVQLLRLRKISLIMPSIPVLSIIPYWLECMGKSLTNLTLICKADIHVTDSLLSLMSEHTPHLEHLHLAGCPKVTNEGVWLMIRNNVKGLQGLSLESFSPIFNMAALHAACARAGGLISLRSFTLTIHPDHSTDAWMSDTASLLAESPLEYFQIYAPRAGTQRALADTFCMRIIHQHHEHLVRFSFHRLQLSLDVIERVCTQCTSLEQLFMLVDHAEMALVGPILARANQLRTLHINLVERPTPYNPHQDALDIVRQCSPAISQVGIETRVWKVERYVREANGVVEVERGLAMIESPDIPEQFLVVRT